MLSLIITLVTTCLTYLIAGSIAFQSSPSGIGSVLFAIIATPCIAASIELFRWALVVDDWPGWIKVFSVLGAIALCGFGMWTTAVLFALGNGFWSFGNEDSSKHFYRIGYVYIAALVASFVLIKFFLNIRKS